MSETILDHGYVPEEHAPDPVIGHGDPTPPGKVAIWLFLASEVMFFIGILGTYIILRSGSPKIFAEHAAILSKTSRDYSDGYGFYWWGYNIYFYVGGRTVRIGELDGLGDIVGRFMLISPGSSSVEPPRYPWL